MFIAQFQRNIVKKRCMCCTVDVLGTQTSNLRSIPYRPCLYMIRSQFRIKGDSHAETCSSDITLHLCKIKMHLFVSFM